MVTPDEMAEHIDTELYFGGLLYKDHACVQPKKLHQGLLQLALDAGVRVFGEQPVSRVKPHLNGFNISTKGQNIHCQQVLMATNGYTQPSVSMFLAKRVMPVPSFIIVTEELGKIGFKRYCLVVTVWLRPASAFAIIEPRPAANA